MGLPKLNTAVHLLELPSTGEEIKFRPFLVKEQKLLMLAQESENDREIFEAMTSIIKSCTFDKIDTTTAPLFDIEYVFLKLRSKSVGGKTNIRVLCPDDGETYVNKEIDLDKIEIQMTDGHTNIANITDKIKVVMKYPRLVDMRGVEDMGNDSLSQAFTILKHCVWEVHDGEKVYNRVDISEKDIEEFIDSFDTTQLEKVMSFFETMPKLRHVTKIKNPKTKVESEITIEGLQSFLG